MISFKKIEKVYLYKQIPDIRKGIDGYISLVESARMDPRDGSMFLFCNRKEDKMKGIFYDGVSMLFVYRRLNEGRILWKKQGEDLILISHKQMKRLLNGLHVDCSGNYRPSSPEYH